MGFYETTHSGCFLASISALAGKFGIKTRIQTAHLSRIPGALSLREVVLSCNEVGHSTGLTPVHMPYRSL